MLKPSERSPLPAVRLVNTGQICTSMERVYVHEDVAEEFVDALVEAANAYTPGDVLGPLVDRRQRDIVSRHVTVYTGDPAHMAAARAIPAGVIWINQWQGGGPERLYEPAGDSGMGATGARAAYDAATPPLLHPHRPGGHAVRSTRARSYVPGAST